MPDCTKPLPGLMSTIYQWDLVAFTWAQFHSKHSNISILDSLRWRQNDHDGVSNHQPHGCLLNRLFGRRSKKTSKLRVTGLCAGNSPGPVNSPHKGPVTRKMFPFDDVIMYYSNIAGASLRGQWVKTSYPLIAILNRFLARPPENIYTFGHVLSTEVLNVGKSV